jgi:hypothetical protein
MMPPFGYYLEPLPDTDEMTFAGWYLGEELLERAMLHHFGTFNFIAVRASWDGTPIVVKPVWTIIFLNSDNTYLESVELFEEDIPYELLDGVDPDGLRSFKGWYFNGVIKAVITMSDFGAEPMIMLKASWQEPYADYMVNKYDSNGYLVESRTISISDLPYYLAPLMAPGRTFEGWYLNPAVENRLVEFIELADFKGLAIIAVWGRWEGGDTDGDPTERFTLVTFDDATGGLAGITQVVILRGGKVAALDDPTKTNYEFVGWFIKGTTERWNFDRFLDLDWSELWLVAAWSKLNDGQPLPPVDPSVIYTVMFEIGEEASFADPNFSGYLTKAKNSLLDEIIAPTREGYEFNGWYYFDDNGYIDRWNFELDIVTSNLALFAEWIIAEEPEQPTKFIIWPLFAGVGAICGGWLFWIIVQSVSDKKRREKIKAKYM